MHRMRALLLSAALGLAWVGPGPYAASKDKTKPGARTTLAAAAANPGYRQAPMPAWVQDPGSAADERRSTESGRARRELLYDHQVRLTDAGPVTFTRMRRMALDASTLKDVSELTLDFNPAYQKLILHHIVVQRGGERLDRTRDTRIEVLRREQQLESQVLDGMHTALATLRDVRVGDVVEVAYSVEGQNPIFQGRFASGAMLALDVPIERLHVRFDAPAHRTLHVRTLPQELPVERFEEAGRQVIRVRRDRTPVIPIEAQVPPWVKVVPAIQVTEYGSWDEVEQWAQDLFKVQPPSGEVARRIEAWKTSGLSGDALLADVLRFVQDEVRYFSTSLGESSHRPQPAERTLSDRKGDCKDKTLLLNTFLTALGFDARAALVSTYRNRGLSRFLPTHDQFDHVVTAITLDGQTVLLDATLQGQGLTLRERGFLDYGQALVIGDRAGIQNVRPPRFAISQLQHRQAWDLSDTQAPTRMVATLSARGLAAERWRAAIASAGLDRIGEALAGSHIRSAPGLRLQGQPLLSDDRTRNQLDLSLRFDHPDFGEYRMGSLDTEFTGVEMFDPLSAPSEARRQFPYWIEGTGRAELRIQVRTPRPFTGAMPAPQTVQDKHFHLAVRNEVQGPEVHMFSRYERRLDEVQPGDLTSFREATLRARQLVSSRLRLSLVDRDAVEAIASAVDERIRPWREGKPDALLRLLQDEQFNVMVSNRVLPQFGHDSPRALALLKQRAESHNHLGQFQQSLQDADRVLQLRPNDSAALASRGVALMGLLRPEEALRSFEQAVQAPAQGPSGAQGWLGIVQQLQGDLESAQRTLRRHADEQSGEEQTFALTWLFLAHDRQRAGSGASAIATDLDRQDATRWPGVLPHFLSGRVSESTLMALARQDTDQTRLRLAEAHFFVGQKHLLAGRTDAARGAFEAVLATRAMPYRELSLAALELARLKAAR